VLIRGASGGAGRGQRGGEVGDFFGEGGGGARFQIVFSTKFTYFLWNRRPTSLSGAGLGSSQFGNAGGGKGIYLGAQAGPGGGGPPILGLAVVGRAVGGAAHKPSGADVRGLYKAVIFGFFRFSLLPHRGQTRAFSFRGPRRSFFFFCHGGGGTGRLSKGGGSDSFRFVGL